MKYVRFLPFLLIVLIIVSCGDAPSRYPDGMWRGIPETQGVGSHGITDFIEEIDNNGLELHSFMLMRHSRVIAEGWWYPYKASLNHIMHSVSKTFTATAIGFAVQEKLLTVDDKVVSFFPDNLPDTVSPNLAKMRIKDLLMMAAGHEAAPTFYMSDENWIRSFLAVPVVDEPGKIFQYSSYATYMLSAIIQKVTGMTTYDYLKPRLFEPLNITDIKWEEGAQGISAGGWGMRIKTADMLKLGQFYLQKGKWGKKQLLPEAWINEATAVQIYQVENPTFEQEMHDEWAQGYAYQIWRCTHNAYRADGANGQFIIVMPDQDAVVAMTSRVSDTKKVLSLLWEYVFTSMVDRPLKENRAANDMMISKLASLQIPDPYRTDETVDLPKQTTRTYTVEPNDLQIQNLSFAFNENGDCRLTLNKDTVSGTFSFGQDTWTYGTTHRLSPYFLNQRRNPKGLAPFDIAGYGSWTKPGQLELRLLYLNETEYETYSCRFTDKEVEIKLTNSARSPEEGILLKGKMQ